MIMIMTVMVVMVVVLMGIVVILGAGDILVDCDGRFGRWWTRRFLPARRVWESKQMKLSSNYMTLAHDLRLTVKIVPSARSSSSSTP